MDSWYRTAKELEAKGESYVLATVIRAVAPTSAKPGDKAVVTASAVVHGWIGGSCAEPTVKKEAALALADGMCRVVQITPDANLPNHREGLVVVPMTCYSGGELEIYLEPHRAKRELLVFGNSPVAQALVELGIAVGYKVTVVDTTERPPLEGATVLTSLDDAKLARPTEAAVVVATHGVFDEDAIARAVGVVPELSRRRCQSQTLLFARRHDAASGNLPGRLGQDRRPRWHRHRREHPPGNRRQHHCRHHRPSRIGECRDPTLWPSGT